jgi:hypothetical protein
MFRLAADKAGAESIAESTIITEEHPPYYSSLLNYCRRSLLTRRVAWLKLFDLEFYVSLTSLKYTSPAPYDRVGDLVYWLVYHLRERIWKKKGGLVVILSATR